ncbi:MULTISPECIES: aspartate/ornithine carbamoyltransferase family protein [Pseudoalteromonas]|uniref:Aspartate carbamoyltransferase n=1 Tax=Pseudoalteromonas maricaloris TaxID=184924 RepID=A0A8I2H6M2_9GAMM|nr:MULTISPECIES: aspartate carbamoyltransferase [Pseudoalteromonas]KID37207.1 aspartate carbamoyltransferase [Pseudoalteromonas flavipulchra NCIMB 2033 = ATCC BAA-314]MBD0783024.1 aspartate carbamoyltransferase [Pseudoalteromonas flavipulchra]MBE0374721.1 aspartate carbamoyltransferase catalytic subunit [Pseudoalteromonas flavipulchra NCIMB 2033 = ATCC BAA-314]NLR22014.1 aspartate carbamoyltransferase [Pseudoalteromonas maricaloris]ODB36240.1 aspartate carbamoyltransferase [Pseudoalteromonas s
MVSAQQVEFNRAQPDVYGDAHPKALLRAIQEDGDRLHCLENKHIISVDHLDRDVLIQLFRLAAKYESNPARFSSPLSGKILISAFYEPSTRTRLSFESAWHRLGGDIMSITDRSSTGIAKGESLQDVAEMFNNYGDCVVLRDTSVESIEEMIHSLRIPIINAGNGIDEHPTQAMSDLYTIFKWRPSLLLPDSEAFSPIKIGVIGVPSQMRTVRSLLKMFTHFPRIVDEIFLLYDESVEDAVSSEQLAQLEEAGVKVSIGHDLNAVLPELDVVYINSIAWVGESFETYGKSFKLSADSPFKPDAIVLHPLARGEELCTSLDATPHNWYFSQARGAVFLRQALLTCMVQRASTVMDVI